MDLWQKMLFGAMLLLLVLANSGYNPLRGRKKRSQKESVGVEDTADNVEDEL